IEVALAVLTGYLAYLPASAAGVSGVLAAVTVGVYMGWYTPELTSVETRLSGNAFWEILTLLGNGLLFVLVRLQLGPIVHSLPRRRPDRLRHVLRDRRDARRAGNDAAVADQAQPPAGGRRRRGAGGREGAGQGGGGGAGAARGARRRGRAAPIFRDSSPRRVR